jgi:hypothetical protein
MAEITGNISRINTLKETSIYLPDEKWNIIYSYVGAHPLATILKPRIILLEQWYRFADGQPPIKLCNLSCRNLRNFHDYIREYSYLSYDKIYGYSGIESNIRDYEMPRFYDKWLSELEKHEMKYFKEFDEYFTKYSSLIGEEEFCERYPYKKFLKYLDDKFCSEIVVCNCGSSIMSKSMMKHLNSEKHKTYLLSA